MLLDDDHTNENAISDNKEPAILLDKNHTSENVHDNNKVPAISTPISKGKFLGGYKHKLTGKIYHHATVQTQPSPWKYEFVLRFNRDAQTVILEDKSQQTPKDACTQVQARNIYLRTTGDKELGSTENYIYADDINDEYLNKIIILQKHIRSWLARQELFRRKKYALLRILWEKETQDNKTGQDIDWMQNLQERRLNPRTADDFRLIFSDLQKWWSKEAKDIAEARTGADLKAAMWLLVIAETKKIEEINKMKHSTEYKSFSQDREKFLNMAAKPKQWRGHNDIIEVQTGNTLRASSLHDLYQTLSMKYISPQDRVDALRSLKEMVRPYHCKLTGNLIQLANREIDLLLRGVKSVHLEGLQTRIRDLFWQYAKKPVYNPEMQRLTKIKSGDSTPHILCCAACKCFYILPTNSTDEILGKSIIENYFRKCKRCLDIENEAWVRKDIELHKRILKLLITVEENKSTASGIIYILQPNDIGHLVENIWKHQSCLSSCREDHDLELTRYDLDKSWTPWNCLLVTRQEAATLERIPKPKMKYDEKFRNCIAQKHTEARRYFSTIPRFLPYLTKSAENSDSSIN